MKYNSHSDEEMCGYAILGLFDGKYDADYGGMACMRTKGHPPPHEATARTAGELDGVHFCCRTPLASHHEPWCIGLNQKTGKRGSE